jgi:pimeloyl-ACP methyl ester carboxylesterase
MTTLWRFTFPVLCIFYLVACNAARTIPVEALGDTPAGVTSRFVFPTSGSTAEAYLTRPAGPGPFPLMILLHGHTFESIAGADSVVPEAEAFAGDLCYAGLAVSLPGYAATEVPLGLDPKITLNVVLDAVSLIKKLPWIDPQRFYLYGFSRGAFFAALLANRLEGIEGIVLHSGAYDLNRFYQDTLWFRSMLNPMAKRTRSLSASSQRSPRGTLRPSSCMVEKILWFPSNRRISYANPWRPPTNLTTSFSIPITVIACRWKTSEEKPPPFSKKPPDRRAVLALSRLLTRILGEASVCYTAAPRGLVHHTLSLSLLPRSFRDSIAFKLLGMAASIKGHRSHSHCCRFREISFDY